MPPGIGDATPGEEEKRLSLGPWIRPGPGALYKIPMGKMSPAEEEFPAAGVVL